MNKNIKTTKGLIKRKNNKKTISFKIDNKEFIVEQLQFNKITRNVNK
jgi:hypothetical protein